MTVTVTTRRTEFAIAFTAMAASYSVAEPLVFRGLDATREAGFVVVNVLSDASPSSTVRAELCVVDTEPQIHGERSLGFHGSIECHARARMNK